jgi:hypothetical protein
MKLFDKILRPLEEFFYALRVPFDEDRIEVFIDRDHAGRIRIFMSPDINYSPSTGGFHSEEDAIRTAEVYNGYRVISKEEYFKKYVNQKGTQEWPRKK